jgi:hypothetical protein
MYAAEGRSLVISLRGHGTQGSTLWNVCVDTLAASARRLADVARLVGCIIRFPWEIPTWRG